MLRLLTARHSYWPLSALVLALALWLRVHDLYNLPIFLDESIHIGWAIRFAANTPDYPILMDGKFLLGVLIALFQLRGPGALWLARAVVGLGSMLSAAASLGLGRRLAGRPAGLAAGLFYALLPQAVLFDRQALADPLMSAFGLVSVVAAYRLATRWRWDAGLALGLGLAASILSKLFGLIYLAFPAALLVALAGRGARLRLAGRYIAGVGLAVLAGGALLWALASRLGVNDGHMARQQVGFIGCPALVCRGSLTDQWNSLATFANALKEEAVPYYGWPVFGLAGLAVLAIPFAPPGRRRARAAWVLGSAAIMGAFALTAKGYVPPRYIIFMAGPLAVLAAVGAAVLGERAARFRLDFLMWAAACGAVLLQPGLTAMQIALDPARAALTPEDRSSLYTPSVGEGIRDAAAAIGPAAQRRDPPPVVLMGGPSFTMVAAYFDRSRVDVRPLSETYTADLSNWLAAGQAIYIFDGAGEIDAHGLLLQPLGAYPRVGPATVRLSRVTGLDAVRRAELFASRFIEPGKLAGNYAALAASLSGSSPLTVLVYPPNQAGILASQIALGHTKVTVTPIGDAWPLSAPAVDAELSAAAGRADALKVVFVEETKGDPSRLMETWLDAHLFRLNETWFGPARLVSYAGGGGDTQTIPAGAVFGGTLRLESVNVLDEAPPPGGLVRLRLTWRALAATPRQYKVFVHIFNGDHILAQHDGQPAGELRPTNTWQAGETIVDQFAIQLPPDATAGGYQLRVGVYDLITQARLPMTLPDGTGGEFWAGGGVTVK